MRIFWTYDNWEQLGITGNFCYNFCAVLDKSLRPMEVFIVNWKLLIVKTFVGYFCGAGGACPPLPQK